MKAIPSSLLTILALLSLMCLSCDDESVKPFDGGHDQDADAATIDEDQPIDAGDEDQPDAADEDQPDAADEDQPDAGDEGPDAGDEDQPTLEVSLPQAIADALNANPDVYDQIPLRINVNGQADNVDVTLEQQVFPATDSDGDGTWIANVDISGLSNGEYQLDVLATNQSGATGNLSADLVISTIGVQLSDYDEVEVVGTPRIHRYGEKAYLTWTDTWEGVRTVWLQEIDGGGRFLGDRVALVDYPDDIVYGRAVFGTDTIGIHIQQAIPSVWRNTFVMVDFQGNLLAGPIDLVPDGRYGSWGGAVAYDGSGYVVANRHNAGAGTGFVEWWRVNESDGAVSSPQTVSDVGGFDPSTFLSIAAIDDRSLVGFVRDSPSTKKAWLTLMESNGTRHYMTQAEAQSNDVWHHECRVFTIGSSFVAIWSGLTSSPDPDQIRGIVADSLGNLDSTHPNGVLLVEDHCNREEPFLMPHPEVFGLLFWIDDRSKGASCQNPDGKVQLFAAKIGADLSVGPETIFEHADFVFSTSQLNATNAGTNAIMVWLDAREGPFRKQMWMDTAWY